MGSPSAYERDSAYYPPSPERARSAPQPPSLPKPSAGYLSRKSLLVDSLKIAAGNRSSTDFDQFVLPPPGPAPELVPPDDDDLVVLCASIFFELGVTDFSKGVGDDYLLCALEHIAGGTTGARNKSVAHDLAKQWAAHVRHREEVRSRVVPTVGLPG